jgi:UDP-hydrolysing UDP-N-acetyl-D-glucosamine 2-epimerase
MSVRAGDARLRTIGVVTVGRSDYGIYLPLLRRFEKEPGLKLQLFVSGAHLARAHGRTVQEIERDGFPIAARIPILRSSDAPRDVATATGKAVAGFGRAFEQHRPDILVVLGDRYEMHAAALAALPFNIPVAHLYGGELTEGAFDDALRHSMTKLSHLHFVSTRQYRRRVLQLGEERSRVHLCGALSLDKLRTIEWMAGAEIESRYGISLTPPPLLVTFHPVTLQIGKTEWQVRELLAALTKAGFPVVFTAPNADPKGSVVRRLIEEFVSAHPRAWLVNSFGGEGYFNMMRHAAVMVGNSSSGIMEAPSFRLPVVNIGIRQKGRVRASNVLDVGHRRADIGRAIRHAMSTDFRRKVQRMNNPYVHGDATSAILRVLGNVCVDERLTVKSFVDWK